MNHDERQLLLSECAAIQSLLSQAPATDLLGTHSLRHRLAMIKAELEAEPVDAPVPARARLTFRGNPVIGTHGIFAEFGLKATQAFVNAVSTIAAGFERPLASVGPVPNKARNQLLITNTAEGSFGFELEAHRETSGLMEDDNIADVAMGEAQALLEATLGDDESLADAVSALEARVISAVRAFLEILSTNGAMCAFEFGKKRFEFTTMTQVKRSLFRLEANDLGVPVSLTGEFQGVLPNSRAFEFKLRDTGDLIKGKVGRGVPDPAALNNIVGKTLAVDFTKTQVGAGKPRYTLNATPAILLAPGTHP